MAETDEVAQALSELAEAAKNLSADVADEVEELLQEGLEKPLAEEEIRRLLSKIVTVIRAHAESTGDEETAKRLAGEEFVSHVLDARRRLAPESTAAPGKRKAVKLKARGDIKPRAVFPRPTFHEHEIPMSSGFVKTSDIELWPDNERLDVHVAQFRAEHGRVPTPPEVLDIMLSKMPLPGVKKEDQFEIAALARSIANNGVRRPPVIDLDGTLLDGNRRVAACNYILHSDEFSTEQKTRAEWIFVWQLTEHATDEDRNLVVVSLNFEPDFKQDWPPYVKARKIYDEWQRMLTLEVRSPSAARQAELKRELSQAFALGPKTDVVNRAIKMVTWADEFEAHQIGERKRDEYEVKHQAAAKFEYFDELSKGVQPGGVAHTLGQEDELKSLAFDLLFANKFKTFTQIRDLKHVSANNDALELLRTARDTKDTETAQEQVSDALSLVKSSRAEKRRLGANAKIETFVEWIEDVPLSAPRDQIKPENLEALLRAFKLVRNQAIEVLGKDRVDEILGSDQ